MIMKNLARWAVYIPLFVIPFLPLYVANDLFFPFITGKGFAFRILIEIAFAGWIVLALADRAYRPRFSWVLVLYGAFVLWMLIADLLGVNPHKALWSNLERMEGWVTLIHVFLFFLVSGSVFTADKLWRKWWLTFLAGAALVLAYCFIQLAGGAPIHQGGARVDGTFGNAAYLAAYLLFVTAIAVWQGLEAKGALRWSLLALGALAAVVTFFTATRGAVLGLLGAGVVAAFLWAIESGGRARKFAAGALIAIVVVAGSLYLLRGTSFVQHDPTLARVTSIGPSDLSVRFTLWHMAFEGVAERPITGWGQEGFNYIFNKFYEPSLYAQEPWFDRAHNAFIDWLVAGGIPGFLLFLSAFGMAIYALYRGGASRQERILFVAALVAYGIQGMVVFDNLFTYVPLAAILATAHAVSSRPWKRFEDVQTIDDSNLQIAGPIVLVLALVVVWFVNVPNIAAANELVHAISIQGNDVSSNVVLFQKALAEPTFAHQEIREQLLIFATNIASQMPAPSQALAQFTGYALDQMGKEVALQPNDSRLRLEYALGYRVVGDYPDALKQIQIAQQNSPKKQSILIEEGIDYWQLGQYDQASKTFDQAYELDPSFTAIAPYAAAGKIISGDLAGGKALLMEKVGTTTVNNDALILAYYQQKDYPDLILSLEQAARDEGGSESSIFRLAAAYAASGNIAGARAIVNAEVAVHPETATDAASFLQNISKGK